MDLEAPSSNNGEEAANFNTETHQALAFEDFDSNCSTPYVSAPSSPGRGPPFGGSYYYSAPASPMHFALTLGEVKLFSQSTVCSSASSSPHESSNISVSSSSSFQFELFGPPVSGETGSMSSADELFLNGKIRPMKLSTHLEQPQVFAPLPDLDTEDEDDPKSSDSGAMDGSRGRDLKLRDKSLRRRTRSMSPLRSLPLDDDKNPLQGIDQEQSVSKIEALPSEASENHPNGTPSVSASSSRSNSAGRSSKRWVFLKDFLRSKSEGRSNNKFWATISFSPAKEKTRPSTSSASSAPNSAPKDKQTFPLAAPDTDQPKRNSGKKPGRPMNGAGKRRVPPSPHELHYTANRAQAEELRKKTFLPYRQGLLGCLGFSSKGYGAMNGFARALNPVSTR